MKLNVGSGRLHLEGYINIDCDESLSPDMVGRIEGMEFERGSVDVIYASHIIEHLDLDTSRLVLFKFFDWLKESGILRVAVPDMMVLTELLSEGIESYLILELIYGKHNAPLNQIHHWGFTESSLKRELEVVGFKVLGRFDPQVDSSGYKICSRLVSLNLECTK